MRERSNRRRRTGAVTAAVLAGVLVAGPALLAQPAMAQTDDPRWAGSSFDAPLDADPAEIDRSSFTVAGTIRHALYDVTEVTLSFGRSVDGELTTDGPCLPDSPEGPVAGPQAEDTEEVRFSVPDVAWPCNGEFVVRAMATAERPIGPADEMVMEAVVVLQAPPPPVSAVDADADADGDTVTVSWDGADPSPDAAGFRVERAGPATEAGSYGRFREVATVEPGTTTVDDSPGEDGDYRYRVRALRAGAELVSPVEGSGTADASIGEPPPETTRTTTRATGGGNDRGTRRATTTSPSRGGARLPTSSPTTIDNGFETEIDYGAEARPLDDGDDDDAAWNDDDVEEPGELAAGASPSSGPRATASGWWRPRPAPWCCSGGPATSST